MKNPRVESGAIYCTWSKHRSLVVIPIAVVVPATIVTVPPSVIPAEASFPFRVQVTPPLICLVAALAVFANRLIELHFPLFDFTLTLRMIVRIRLGHYNEHRCTQSRGHNRRCRKSLKVW